MKKNLLHIILFFVLLYDAAAITANAGGPYIINEDAAVSGIWKVQLNGSYSASAYSITGYTWLTEPLLYNFAGSVIDTLDWSASSNVAQNNGVTISGSGTWGARYFFSRREYEIAAGVTFQATVLSDNATHNAMFGFKNYLSGYSYTQLPYAIYFNNGSFYIYENGTSRGVFGSYARNTMYDIRIVLKDPGARYYYKSTSSSAWTLLYDSNFSTMAPLTAGVTVAVGTLRMYNVSIIDGAKGIYPALYFSKPGIYPVTLNVVDSNQEMHSNTTTITINDGAQPQAAISFPAAMPGNTYEAGSFVAFSSLGTSDDFGIEKYEWTFGDTTGTPLYLPYKGKSAKTRHVYKTPGTYNVTLTVTDRTGKSSNAAASVNIITGNAPTAAAGGPYTCEAGGSPVYFNGSASGDDYGIIEYRWDTDNTVDSNADGDFTNDINVTGRNPLFVYTIPTGLYFTENFEGTVIDSSRWINSGAVQNDKITIRGAGAWTNRYITGTDNIQRANNIVFDGQVQVTSTGSQNMMWGVKDSGTTYNYTQMPHAVYFNNGNLHVYENGTNRGIFGTYTTGLLYDVRIQLKTNGALYFIKPAAAGEDYTKLYESTTAVTTTPLKAFAAVYNGSFDFDRWTVRGPDYHTATLTVEDGCGQKATAQTQVFVSRNLPPQVITVPGAGATQYHETYNGKAVTFKGIVRDADPVYYRWDFGDNTSTAQLAVTNAYNLAATHVYPNETSGRPFTATLTVWDSKGQTGSDTYEVRVMPKTLSVETNIAIDEALWYLHTQQTRTTTNGYPSGWWRMVYNGSSFYSAAVASVLQAFEINGFRENGDNANDPYAETVSRGFKYLFSRLNSAGINNQTYGNPDTNGNGIGIQVNESYPIYQGGPVLDAIASSAAPLERTVTGGTNVIRRSYYDILTDMVDMFAWGQYDNSSVGGGWRYDWNTAPDNSAAQWGAIGMQAAEDLFDIPIPGWVKVRNNVWLNYSYNGAQFGYADSSSISRATTPSGLVQLAFDRKTTDDIRWQTAEKYIASVWSASNSNSVIYRWRGDNNEYSRDYYAMYAFAKAMRLAYPQPVVNLKYNDLDWYNNPVNGMARCVIDDQLATGRISGTYRSDNSLRTAWGVVILSQTLFQIPPAADAGRDYIWAPGQEITLDGSGSYHPDAARSIIKYEWDFNGDGIYDYAGESPIAHYTYNDAVSTLPRTYAVTMRVSDDNLPALTDTDTALITIAPPPHPPIAVVNGPYRGTAGLPVVLDGTASHELDPTDYITAYRWELDLSYPYGFNEENGSTPAYTWNTPGTYNLGLQVWDNGILNDIDHDGICDENERLSGEVFSTVTIYPNLAPTAGIEELFLIDEGQSVTFDAGSSADPNGDPLVYSWDLDNDGQCDDAAGVIITHNFPHNGTYTVTLQVSDTLLSDLAQITVIVRDLSPTAAFSWEPENPVEGMTVQFTGLSRSHPDAIVSRQWNFAGLGSSTAANSPFIFAENGVYPVTLLVTDEDGSQDSITYNITVLNYRPSVYAGPEQTVTEGAEVLFNGSFSDLGIEDTHTIIWDFGDGSAPVNAALQPVHIYAHNGVYYASLAVIDDEGDAGIGYVKITVPDAVPQADFTWEPDLPGEETAVHFIDRSSSRSDRIAAWNWDFSGMSGSSEQYPLYRFQDNGAYAVTLTVTDEDGSVSGITKNVMVLNQGPLVNAGSDRSGMEGDSLLFCGSFYDPGSLDTHTSSWDFGDNSPLARETLVPEHTYTKNGEYTVTLTVTDDDGGVGTDTAIITIGDKEPGAAFTWNPEIQYEGLPVEFTDRSVSSPDSITSWSWQFGGTGTSSLQHPAFVFDLAGTYNVFLTITDEDGSQSVVVHQIIIVNEIPSVYAGPDQAINEGSGITFAGSYTDHGNAGAPEITWGFGDDSEPVTGQLLTEHIYNDNGFYHATLTVNDPYGATGTDTADVVVYNMPPTVDAGQDQVVDNYQTVQFNGSFSDPGILDTHTIAWDFGDNSTGADTLSPIHSYMTSGVYLAVLRVTDKDGGVGTDTLQITVNPSNHPPVANAGIDLQLEANLQDMALVPLDGSASYDTDGDNLTWCWSGAFGTAYGAAPSIQLPTGIHTITLEVSDGEYNAADTVVVAVKKFTPLKTIVVRLQTSTGSGLPGGLVTYCDGEWHTAGVTGADGCLQIEMLPGSHKFRITYLGREMTKYQDISINPLVVFTTQMVTIHFKDSKNTAIAGGIIQYLNGAWFSIGTTDANGNAQMEFLPGKYKFGVDYKGVLFCKTQDLTLDPTVVFQTIDTEIRFLNSYDRGLAGGLVKYFNTSWYTIGETDSSGSLHTELLPGMHKFTLNYRNGCSKQSRDITVDPVVVFHTVKTEIRLTDSYNQGIAGCAARIYTDKWLDIGITDASGITQVELLPGNYKFSVTYAEKSSYINQDITLDNIVLFQTKRAEIRLLDSNGNGIMGCLVKYYYNTCNTIGTTNTDGVVFIELLAGNYKFSAEYNGTIYAKYQDIGYDPIINLL